MSGTWRPMRLRSAIPRRSARLPNSMANRSGRRSNGAHPRVLLSHIKPVTMMPTPANGEGTTPASQPSPNPLKTIAMTSIKQPVATPTVTQLVAWSHTAPRDATPSLVDELSIPQDLPQMLNTASFRGAASYPFMMPSKASRLASASNTASTGISSPLTARLRR